PADGHVDVSVRHGESAALLLDLPVHGAAVGGKVGLPHDVAAVGEVEPEDREHVRAHEGRHVDAVGAGVDDGRAEDALRRDVAADPAGGGRGAEVLEPDGRAIGLVDCVDGVVEGRDVDDALVDEGLRVNRGVEGAGNTTGGRAGGGGL